MTQWPALPPTGVLFALYSIISTLIYDLVPVNLLLYLAWFTLLQGLSGVFTFAIPVLDDALDTLLELRY